MTTPETICRYCKMKIELRAASWHDREATTGLWFPGCSRSPTGYHDPARRGPPVIRAPARRVCRA